MQPRINIAMKIKMDDDATTYWCTLCEGAFFQAWLFYIQCCKKGYSYNVTKLQIINRLQFFTDGGIVWRLNPCEKLQTYFHLRKMYDGFNF